MDSARDSRYSARRATQSCVLHRAPVAQLDRVLPSEGRGRTFESFRARHKIKGLGHFRVAFFLGAESLRKNAAARRIALLELPRPGPGVDDAQRFVLGRHHVGRMQVEHALGFQS